jgi:hypothetical protein
MLGESLTRFDMRQITMAILRRKKRGVYKRYLYKRVVL